MPRGRTDRAVAVVGGKVYLFGGDCCTELPTDVYDPATDTWSEAAPMPTARGDLGVAVVDGIIYAIGGWSGSPGCCNSGVNEAYDPATNTWSTKAPLPVPRSQFACVAIEGRVYVLGGYGASSSMYSYDPGADAWTEEPPLPGPINWSSATAVGSRILRGGGVAGVGGACLKSCAFFDTALKTWADAPDLCEGRSYGSMVVANGKCLYAGGLDATCDAVTTVYALTLDATAPATPSVTDDGPTTPSSTELHAAWSSSDSEFAITEYTYAIGTAPADPGSGYVVGWKSAGAATEATETGLSLQSGQTYYWYVKAKNAVGLWSEVGVSDGIAVRGTFQLLVAIRPPNDGNTDWRSVKRWQIADTGGSVTALADIPKGEVNDPVGLAWRGRNELLVAGKNPATPSSGGVDRLLLTPDGVAATHVGRITQPGMGIGQGLSYHPATKRLFFGATNGIYRFDWSGGQPLFEGTTSSGRIADAYVGQSSTTLYACTYDLAKKVGIFTVGADGSLAPRTSPANPTGLAAPTFFKQHLSGELYLSQTNVSGIVFRYTTDEQGDLTYKSQFAFPRACGIGFSPDGQEMFVARNDSAANKGGIYRFRYQAATDTWEQQAEYIAAEWAADIEVFVPYHDSTAAAAPVVTDDGATTTSLTQLHASWLSDDPDSGILAYQYAIGTAASDPGSGYMVDWKSAGTATEATETGLFLQPGETYYWYVRAKNGAGLWSEAGVSDGIKVAGQVVMTPGAAKLLPDGTAVGLLGARVTATSAAISGRIYVEDPMRSSGIAALSSAEVAEGDVVNVAGVLATNGDGERIISDATVLVTGHESPLAPVLTNLRCAASAPWQYQAGVGVTVKGQRGVTDPPGEELTTVGLLLEVQGAVMDMDGSFAFLNDGAWPDRTGVRVLKANLPTTLQVGDFVRITGISSMRKAGTAYQLVIRPRRQSDLEVFVPAGEGLLRDSLWRMLLQK